MIDYLLLYDLSKFEITIFSSLFYISGGVGIGVWGCNIPSERFFLAREGIFLALSKRDRYFLYGYIFQRGLPVAAEYKFLQSP
jgi:hypothetical protein